MSAMRAALFGLAALVAAGGVARAADDDAARGEYLVHAGGCVSCHTQPGGGKFAGGRALKTPFGTFYSPNITPDRETGIGAWSDTDFQRALREGIGPDGRHYFPVFPYPSFTGITDDDARAIKAYLFSLPPAHAPDHKHDVWFPFSWRFLQVGWRLLFFDEGPFEPDQRASAAYNRGGYLVTALAHCGECHTPRNFLGAVDSDRALSGNPDGPDGRTVPNITPDPNTGIGDWGKNDIATLLKTGETPEHAQVKGAMHEAIEDGLKYLTDGDRQAIATYLLAQKPVVNEVKSAK